MAKLNHVLFGQAKGKVGGVVLQRYEGMNIAREKPITVKNPQSTKQTEQRAKFKTASQMTAIFKEVFMLRLSKLSIYNRTRRGVVINTLTRIATIENEDTAAVDFESAVSAINAKSLSEYSAPEVVISGSNYQVTAPAEAIIHGVIAGFDASGNFVSRKVVEQTSGGSAVSFAVLPNVDTQRAVFVYTIATTEEGRATYNNINLEGNQLGVEIERLIASGDASVSDITGIDYPQI